MDIEQINNQIKYGVHDQAGHKENFLMAQEYYDFIEFLQNKLGFDEVDDLQKEFGGSFVREEEN